MPLDLKLWMFKRLTFGFWRWSPIWASMASLLLSIWPLAPLFCFLSLSSLYSVVTFSQTLLVDSLTLFRCGNQAEQSRLLPGGKYLSLSQFWKIKITQSLVGLIEVWSSILFTTNWLGLWCSYAVYILWDFSASSLLKIRLASAPVKAFASKCA